MTFYAAPLLTLGRPSVTETDLITELANQLNKHTPKNREKLTYYESERLAEEFGISIPPSMQNYPTPTGWAGTVVDVVEERLDWLGWSSSDDEDPYGLREVFDTNFLSVEGGLAHLDSLIFGSGFVVVGTGLEGEPDPLITMHSPLSMTAKWSARARRNVAAYSVLEDDYATLYLPNQTVTLVKKGPARWEVADRDEHNLNRVPVVQFENRARSDVRGRSEITKAIRYYMDAAIRTLLGMEVSREFYNAPKLAAMNVREEEFMNADGTPASQWTSVMGRMWFAPPNEESEAEPKLIHIPAASPAPYVDQINAYAVLVAAEAGIPPTYLGLASANPSSADAIRALESRLVKRVERRQTVYGRSWMEVGRLAVMVRDGGPLPDMTGYATDWRDASTPTRAAAADEALKLISSGILTPDSKVTYDRIGLSPTDQLRIAADKRRARSRLVLDSLTGPGNAPGVSPNVNANVTPSDADS